jgi:signal transduction histidine kinase
MTATSTANRPRDAHRIRVGVAALVITLVLTSLLAVFALRHDNQVAHSEIRRHADDLIGASHLAARMQEAAAADRAYLLTGNRYFIEEFARLHEQFLREAAAISARARTQRSRQLLAAVIDAKEQHATAVATASARDDRPADALFAELVFPRSEMVSRLLASYVGFKEERLAEATASADRQARFAFWILLALLLCNIAIAAIALTVVRTALAKLDRYGHRLRQAVATRDRFLAMASHELRTPLSVVTMQAQVLRQRLARSDSADAAELEPFADRIERNADAIADLVTRMLDLSELESGHIRLRPETVDLAALVRDVAARMAPLLECSACRLEIDARDQPVGQWDRARIEQIVANLITNFVRHACSDDRPVPATIRIEQQHALARLVVEDRGPGISTADIEHIFTPFERGSGARDSSGLGVGLALCREIARAHGGQMRAESELGHGARFIVELPLRAGGHALGEEPG